MQFSPEIARADCRTLGVEKNADGATEFLRNTAG